MKILIIASFADSILNFRGPLIVALKAAGLQVHVAAPELGIDSSVRQRLEVAGVYVHNVHMRRVGTNPVDDIYTFFQLWQLMRVTKPDIVLCYTMKPVIYGILAAWMNGVPRRFALITGLGYAFTGKSRGRRAFVRALVQRLYRVAFECAHKVFFQNRDDEALFKSLNLIPKVVPTVVVNGSGVDLSHFGFVALRAKTPRFLLVARLLGDKGVREYAQAAHILRQIYQDATFSLAGWLDDNPDSIHQNELNQWVAQGDVRFLGHLTDVRAAISECTVYVLPSYREGIPRTVLEAMAMGRAVITTDAPGCRETVVHGFNGFLVPVKRADLLAQAMERFFSEPELAIGMGHHSRQLAEEKFDVHQVNARILAEMGVTL